MRSGGRIRCGASKTTSAAGEPLLAWPQLAKEDPVIAPGTKPKKGDWPQLSSLGEIAYRLVVGALGRSVGVVGDTNWTC